MNQEIIINELEYKAVRSSGPGGQHVNKTSSKVEVSFLVEASQGLSETEKERILAKLSNRISQAGYLSLSASDSRSQHKNKAIVTSKLLDLLRDSLKVKKKRKKTKPSKAAIEKRLQKKKSNAMKKANRKPPKID